MEKMEKMDKAAKKTLVGVNYFAGWWRETPNKWQDSQNGFADWRGKYPERIPMYGCFNDQATMDSDIVNASDHGVDYFQILWYPVNCEGVDEAHFDHLNEGLSHFMNSKENGRMKFCVEYCNHPPFSLVPQKEWDEACELWCEAFAHPSYLKPNGKILFKVHGHDYLMAQFGGVPGAARRLSELREKAKNRTGLDMIITSGVTQGNDPLRLRGDMEAGIDFFSTYMDIPPDEPVEVDYDYERLFGLAEDMAEKYGLAGVSYQPYFPAGWNPRPWHDPRPCYALPGRVQIAECVKKLMEIIDRYDCLGISERGFGRVKAFTVYAWNEYGEGGMLAPNIIDGFSRLLGLKEALSGPKS